MVERLNIRMHVLLVLPLLIVCVACNSTPAAAPTIEALNCSKDLLIVDQATSTPLEKIVFLENENLRMMDPSGKNLADIAKGVERFEIASDHRRLVYRLLDGTIFVYELRSQKRRLIQISEQFLAEHHIPDWSPDGQCLVFIDNPSNVFGLYHLSNDQLDSWSHPYGSSFYGVMKISPDGKYLAIGCPSNFDDLCVTNTSGTELYQADKNANRIVRWSPDGQYLLYYIRSNPNPHTLPALLFFADRSHGWNHSLLWQKKSDALGVKDFEWSPDGAKVLAVMGVSSLMDPEDLAVISFPQGIYRQLHLSPFWYARSAAWSPDSDYIVFVGSKRDVYKPNNQGIYTVKEDGTDLQHIFEGTGIESPVWVQIP